MIKHCLIFFKWGIRLHVFHHGFFCEYAEKKGQLFSRYYDLNKNSFCMGKFYIEFF